MGTLGSGPTIASVWFANKSTTTTVGGNGNLIDSPTKAKGTNNSIQPTGKPKVHFNVSKLLLFI